MLESIKEDNDVTLTLEPESVKESWDLIHSGDSPPECPFKLKMKHKDITLSLKIEESHVDFVLEIEEG